MTRRHDYDIFSEAGRWGFTVWHNVMRPKWKVAIDLRQKGYATLSDARSALIEAARLNNWKLDI